MPSDRFLNVDVTIKKNEPWLSEPTGLKSQKIALDGAWSLTKDHQLVYRLKGQHSQRYWRKLVFDTKLIEAKESQLVFSITHQVSAKRKRTQIIELSGNWRLDRFKPLAL